MHYEGVIFDLDGTLLDTLQDLADSTNAVLARLGYPRRPVEEYRTIVGDGLRNQIRRALPQEARTEETVDRMIPLVGGEYAERWNATTLPYDGIPELLDALAGRGIRMAVLTNKPHEFAVTVVDALLGDWEFDFVQGATPDLPLKPDPTPARQVAVELELSPERIAYVGDTNTDMETAVNAGMFAVGVLWGFRTAEELKAYGAEVLIERPKDLLELL